MKSEQIIKGRLRELRLASLRVQSPEMNGWIEALAWILNENELMAA